MSDYNRNVSPVKLPFKITPRLIIIVVIAIVLVIAAATSFFVVDATEQAVVTTLGKFNRFVDAGLHLKLPFGVEQSYNVPTQVVQSMSFGFRETRTDNLSRSDGADYPEESIMLTGDLNIVDVEWTILYRITDIKKWLFAVESKENTIRDISQSVVSELIGDRTISDALGPARSAIQDQAVILMNALYEKYNLGITVTQVQMQNIVPPVGRVQQAFQDVNKSTQDMERLINEGKERYNTEIPKARGEALQIVKQAEGYASERVNKAEGDVARFISVLQQYRLDPRNTRVRLYNEMIEEVFGNPDERSTLLDKDLESALPLLNLNSSSRPQASGGAQ